VGGSVELVILTATVCSSTERIAARAGGGHASLDGLLGLAQRAEEKDTARRRAPRCRIQRDTSPILDTEAALSQFLSHSSSGWVRRLTRTGPSSTGRTSPTVPERGFAELESV